MSWSDFFYPGNPERREMLIRKDQEIKVLMENNFRATNQLVEVLNKHLNLSLSPIALDEKATVKENCDVIIECINEIQAEVEKIDTLLKEKLDPALYEILRNKSLSVPNYQTVVTAVHVITGVGSIAAVALIVYLITSNNILIDMKNKYGTWGTLLFASLPLGVFFAGIDAFIQAIIGSYEREALEKALEEYDKSLKEFKPASHKYQDHITDVRMRIEMLNNFHILL
ncbi:hypothetical protein R3I93_010622 [Phoxinus phoxinus]|uniref:Single-pass membrane and coiled-coil domain-containing protein 3 n=1 Tax=Phoxinus phoxinus TaxID=58324 RepID=A0AAN9H5C1_9TELE